MFKFRIVALLWLAGAMGAAGAFAKTEWKTVTLRGETGLTISIPEFAKDYDRVTNPDDLMFLSLSASRHGEMTCIANRIPYTQGVTQASLSAALVTDRRNAFCNESGAGVSDLSIGESRSFMHNGLQAAVCTASFTDKSQSAPGRVSSQMVIAAKLKVYVLTCTSEDEDQEMAEYEWGMTWGDTVKHFQDSFHLPE